MNLLLSLPLAQGGFPFLFFVLDWLQKLQWFQCEPILVSGVALRYLWLYSSGQEGLIFLWVLSNLEFTLSVTNRLILDLGKSEVFSQFIDTQYFGIKLRCIYLKHNKTSLSLWIWLWFDHCIWNLKTNISFLGLTRIYESMLNTYRLRFQAMHD